jgi:solute carrier family 66, member 2
MIIMQVVLLHAALTYRAQSFGAAAPPFAPSFDISNPTQTSTTTIPLGLNNIPRPYNFWRWRTSTPYWRFLAYWMAGLVGLQLLFGQFPMFPHFLGTLALSIEAILPVPQLLANQARKSCLGFRLSVLANWLIGDAFKMVFFMAKGAEEVPWAFKLCGMFQAACDIALGCQFYMYGDGTTTADRDIVKDLKWLGDKGMEMIGMEKADGDGHLRSQENGTAHAE